MGDLHNPSKRRIGAIGPRRAAVHRDAPMQEKPGGYFYSVAKVAKLPGGTPGRIRQMLRAGQLEGAQEGDDPHAPWKVHQTSVEAHRDRSGGHVCQDGL